jgi:putative membrane protein
MRVLKLDQALALERLVRQRGQAAPQAADVGLPPRSRLTPNGAAAPVDWDVVRMGLLSNRGWALAAPRSACCSRPCRGR